MGDCVFMISLDFPAYFPVLVEAIAEALDELNELASASLGAIGIYLVPPTLNTFWLLAWGEEAGWHPTPGPWGVSVVDMSVSNGIDIADPVGIGLLPIGTTSVLVTNLDGTQIRVPDPINTDELAALLLDMVVPATVEACRLRPEAAPQFVVVEVTDSTLITVLERRPNGDYAECVLSDED